MCEMKYFQILSYPLGKIVLQADEKHLISLRFAEDNVFFDQNPNNITEMCATQLEEYFTHRRKKFDCPLLLDGTFFQVKIWKTLLQVPYGHVVTYKQLARMAGVPRAVRAVANALGANKLPVFVPCHRVIRSDGSLGGFTPGLHIKKFLLNLEGVTF